MVPATPKRLNHGAARDLLQFLEGLRGPDGVIRRAAFGPEGLLRWLGGIAIHQWDRDRNDYVYRLFGTLLAENVGRDLTGRTLAEWPPVVAQIMRDQADTAISTGAAVISHYRLRVMMRDGVIENRIRTQEKIVVPIAYPNSGGPDAVLVYVDQSEADITILRELMDAVDGSCWCVAGRLTHPGCPMGGTDARPIPTTGP